MLLTNIGSWLLGQEDGGADEAAASVVVLGTLLPWPSERLRRGALLKRILTCRVSYSGYARENGVRPLFFFMQHSMVLHLAKMCACNEDCAGAAEHYGKPHLTRHATKFLRSSMSWRLRVLQDLG